MQPKIRTFKDKVRDAIRAFRGKQIGSITFGVDIKQCKDCEYKKMYEQCFELSDCDRELIASFADGFDRVNPPHLRKSLERFWNVLRKAVEVFNA